MTKPWYRSLTLTGAVGTALAILTSPAVLSILPPKAATAVGVVTGLATLFGLRKALPDAPSDKPAQLNTYGETPAQEAARRAAMDAEAARTFGQGKR